MKEGFLTVRTCLWQARFVRYDESRVGTRRASFGLMISEQVSRLRRSRLLAYFPVLALGLWRWTSETDQGGSSLFSITAY
jgi:hypothetical protein